MEQEYGASWMNPRTRNDTVFYSGKWSSKSNRMIPYTIGLETRIDTLFTTKNRLIRIDAITFSPKEVPDATLVVDYQLNGKSLSYNQFILEKYVRPNQWTPVSVAFYVPANFPDQGTVKVYFYNPSPLYNFYIDDLNIDFISLKEEADYRKIEGVLLPEAIKDF
jgi:hypothetical protein